MERLSPGSGPRAVSPSPSSGPPARPLVPGQRGSGLHAGPRDDSQPRGRMQTVEATATVRPHVRAASLALTLPRQQTEPPPEFSKTNAPTVGGAQARQSCLGRRPPARPPQSRDPVISGGPRTRSILGPEGSEVPRSPSPGLQARPSPKEPLREWSVGLSLGCWPPTPTGQVGY